MIFGLSPSSSLSKRSEAEKMSRETFSFGGICRDVVAFPLLTSHTREQGYHTVYHTENHHSSLVPETGPFLFKVIREGEADTGPQFGKF